MTPPEAPKTRSISAIMRDLGADPAADLTLGMIVERFGRRAFGALILIFAAPNLLPLPPGTSTFLAIPMLLIAPQVAIGVKALWLPRRLRARRLSGADAARVFGPIIPWIARAETVSRPRGSWMFGPVGDRLIGLVCTLLALVLVLPLPFGNMLPGGALSLLALSLVIRDGVLAICGYALALVSAGVLVLAASVVARAFHHLVSLGGGA